MSPTGWSNGPSNAGREWKFTAPWRQEVQRRRTLLQDDLIRLDLTGDANEERTALIALLDDADTASQAKVNVRKWWWGTEVERAWGRLREVEERTVDLVPDAELPTRAADASAHADFYLTAGEKHIAHLETLRLEAMTSAAPPAGMRVAIVEVLRSAHAHADRLNQQARHLRNRLLLATCLNLLFATLLVIAQARLPTTPFLYPSGNRPPTGWTGSSWQFLLVVMLFGTVGALLTGIAAIARIPSDYGPFNLPLQQGFLKLSLGPIVAVVGLAIVNTEPLEAKPPTSFAGIMVLAIVLGAGQHAVTSYVDQRADKILTAAAPGDGTTG